MKEKNCNEKSDFRNEKNQKNQKGQKNQRNQRNNDCDNKSDEKRQ